MYAPTVWLIWAALLAFLLTAVLVSGCAPKPSTVVPTKEILLESLVAEAVETQRAQGNQESLRAATLTFAAAQPAVLQAQTLTPTITATSEPTPTLLTPLATLPLFDTATPTPPIAPTRQPGDPALRLGNPDWTDTFDSSQNWSEFSTSRSQIKVQGGQFLYTVFSPGSGPTWTISWPTLSNFYLEVLVQTPAVCSGKDRLGLVFRAPEPSQGYRFEISCDGQYSAVVFDDTSSQLIVAWASSPYLQAGPNQINRIGVWAQGKVIAFHINGQAVAGLEHNDYRSGTFGLSVTSEATENFTGTFDDLFFWVFE